MLLIKWLTKNVYDCFPISIIIYHSWFNCINAYIFLVLVSVIFQYRRSGFSKKKHFYDFLFLKRRGWCTKDGYQTWKLKLIMNKIRSRKKVRGGSTTCSRNIARWAGKVSEMNSDITCSKGQEKVSGGIHCSQESRERSLTDKLDDRKNQ